LSLCGLKRIFTDWLAYARGFSTDVYGLARMACARGYFKDDDGLYARFFSTDYHGLACLRKGFFRRGELTRINTDGLACARFFFPTD
jgi:hypothetical protein